MCPRDAAPVAVEARILAVFLNGLVVEIQCLRFRGCSAQREVIGSVCNLVVLMGTEGLVALVLQDLGLGITRSGVSWQRAISTETSGHYLWSGAVEVVECGAHGIHGRWGLFAGDRRCLPSSASPLVSATCWTFFAFRL